MKHSIVFLTTILLASGVAFADQTSGHDSMVMQHGAQVMPFNQNLAMHMFTPNSQGGIVEVMVHGMDPKQIALVRSHLKGEAAKFGRGDYSDSAYIHGKKMPGLAELSAGASHMQISYFDTEMGGKIVLRTDDPQLVAAVHSWLAAQSRDHNGHSGKYCPMPL